MNDLFNLFQNMSSLLETSEFSNILIGDSTSYNMSRESLFLDIGSGFGKPNFHAAFQIGCESLGIEVVPARVEFCVDFYYEYLSKGTFFNELNKTLISNEEPTTSLLDSDDAFNSDNSDNCFDSLCRININLNELNGTIYEQIYNEKYYIDYNFNKQIIYEDAFYTFFRKTKIPGLLIADNNLQWDNFFSLTKLVGDTSKKDDKLSKELKTGITNHLFSFLNLRRVVDKVSGISNQILQPAQIQYSFIDFTNFINSIENFDNIIMYNLIIFTNILFNFYNEKNFGQEVIMKAKNYNIKNGNGNGNSNGLNSYDCYNNDNDDNCDTVINSTTSKKGKKASSILNKNKSHITMRSYFGREPKSIIIEEDQLDDPCNILKRALKTKKHEFYSDWYEKIKFLSNDATKYKFFGNDKQEHFTHIYSYNKLMSKECRLRISKVLNKTNFKILAWYSNPKQTTKSGLKNVKFVCKFPMQSTSTEKFHCYVYVKVNERSRKRK